MLESLFYLPYCRLLFGLGAPAIALPPLRRLEVQHGLKLTPTVVFTADAEAKDNACRV